MSAVLTSIEKLNVKLKFLTRIWLLNNSIGVVIKKIISRSFLGNKRDNPTILTGLLSVTVI